MIPVLGEPFLYWPTAFFAYHGIRRFVYSTGYMGEQIGRWCTDASIPGLTRQICQESEPLGTGGGLLKALSHCGDWVWLPMETAYVSAGCPSSWPSRQMVILPVALSASNRMIPPATAVSRSSLGEICARFVRRCQAKVT